jgi:hypothetical protein
MKVGYDPDLYAYTDGRYACVFDGVAPFKATGALGRDGLPLGDGLKWQFKFAEGPDAGKQFQIVTGMQPSLKNACGRLIMSMMDLSDIPADGFDDVAYRGGYYKVSIRDGAPLHNPPPSYIGRELPPAQGATDASKSKPSKPKPGKDDAIPF